MIEVIRAAAELQSVCQEQGWQYCVIGGLALQRWGEPRETVDVDLTLLTGFGDEESYIKVLLQRFHPRIDEVEQFALKYRVLLLRTDTGVGLDIALGALPFEESVIQRSSLFNFPGPALIRTCSAEDLIVMKAIAHRPKDLEDIRTLAVKYTHLDFARIERWIKEFAELLEMPELWGQIEKILKQQE